MDLRPFSSAYLVHPPSGFPCRRARCSTLLVPTKILGPEDRPELQGRPIFMLVRQYRESDLVQLRAIHGAQGFDYALPDLSNPLFVTKLVLAQGDSSPALVAQHAVLLQRGAEQSAKVKPDASPDGAIVGAAFLRLTAEAYLLLDPSAGTPRERWQWLLALHAAAERNAWQRGLEDVHAWLPPPIAAKFGKRLARLGWLRDDTWTPYCRRLSTPCVKC